jgi:hypothetical protein
MSQLTATSPIGPAIAVEGLLLQIGNGASPDAFNTIANATDLSLPIITDTIDVTNVGDSWKRRIPTLHDMGKISFKVFWVMEDVTHRNSAAANIDGLRWCLVQSALRDFQCIYPDGNNSTDAFPAYVTEFGITGKVGGVFDAAITLSNSGAPQLV